MGKAKKARERKKLGSLSLEDLSSAPTPTPQKSGALDDDINMELGNDRDVQVKWGNSAKYHTKVSRVLMGHHDVVLHPALFSSSLAGDGAGSSVTQTPGSDKKAKNKRRVSTAGTTSAGDNAEPIMALDGDEDEQFYLEQMINNLSAKKNKKRASITLQGLKVTPSKSGKSMKKKVKMAEKAVAALDRWKEKNTRLTAKTLNRKKLSKLY